MSAAAEPWQIQIFRKSLKKREKVALLDGLIPEGAHSNCLEIGCAKGTISYFLRKRGGRWVHVDLDEANVTSAVKLLDEQMRQATIMASHAGFIDKIYAQPGTYVRRGDPIMDIVVKAPKTITAMIPEADSLAMAVGGAVAAEEVATRVAEVVGA